MGDKEKTLSEYIDDLNAEKKPKEHEQGTDSPELEELMNTVRMVKSLREPAVPDAGFGKKLSKNVAVKMQNKNHKMRPRKRWFIGIASVAAVLAIVIMLNFTMIFGPSNIVYAMEQAYKDVQAYHGIIEITETNAEGQKTVQAKREVWADKNGHYYLKEIEGLQKGHITVNNGEQKWQTRPDSKQTTIFSSFPDPYRFTFEIGREIEDVKNAIEKEILGEEQVSGREAVILEVTPQGGVPYKLWIDKETKLPLKRQIAMQNALQYTIAYTSIEFLDAIPAELLVYSLPEGFAEINTKTEQLVNNPEEAQEAVGFAIELPENLSPDYTMDAITIEKDKKIAKIYFTEKNKQNKVVVLQGLSKDEFTPAPRAVLGKVNGSIAEIQSPIAEGSGIIDGAGAYAGAASLSSIRWQSEGFEYAVIGDVSLDALRLFAGSIAKGEIQIPSAGDRLPAKPQTEVPVDMEAEENEQKSVDAGHTPWKLDSVFTAQVFVSLQLSPEGIQGEYPVQYEDFKIEQNTGSEAVLTLKSDMTSIHKVYLKKLIRQDNTGIWTVVGYDTAQ